MNFHINNNHLHDERDSLGQHSYVLLCLLLIGKLNHTIVVNACFVGQRQPQFKQSGIFMEDLIWLNKIVSWIIFILQVTIDNKAFLCSLNMVKGCYCCTKNITLIIVLKFPLEYATVSLEYLFNVSLFEVSFHNLYKNKFLR